MLHPILLNLQRHKFYQCTRCTSVFKKKNTSVIDGVTKWSIWLKNELYQSPWTNGNKNKSLSEKYLHCLLLKTKLGGWRIKLLWNRKVNFLKQELWMVCVNYWCNQWNILESFGDNVTSLFLFLKLGPLKLGSIFNIRKYENGFK